MSHLCPRARTGFTTSTSTTAIQVARAFTLVEILVVVAIIAVLVAITTMIGSSVINTGKIRATQGVLQTLDSALAAYIDEKGDIPPALVGIPYASLPSQMQGQYSIDELAYYPAIDGRGREGTGGDLITVNSVALFIESAKVVTSTQDLINSIDTKYLQNYSPDVDPENNPVQPFLLTAFDAWGNPIRYVHPKFDGIIERERRALTEPGEPVNIVNPNKPFFVRGALPVDFTRTVRMNFVRRNRLIDADFGDAGLSGGGGGSTWARSPTSISSPIPTAGSPRATAPISTQRAPTATPQRSKTTSTSSPPSTPIPG